MNFDVMIGIVVYGAIGYLGGWLFKGDAHIRERFGIIAAFLITYVSFVLVTISAAQLSDMQDWILTGTFATAFVFRFFIKHG